MFKLTHVFTTNVVKMCNATLSEQSKNLLSVLLNVRDVIWCSLICCGSNWIFNLFDHSKSFFFITMGYFFFLFDPNVHKKIKQNQDKGWYTKVKDIAVCTMNFIFMCLVHTRCDSKSLGVAIWGFFNIGDKNLFPDAFF